MAAWAVVTALSGWGCAGADALKPALLPGALERDTRIPHEACDAASADASRVDVNGDGKADIVHVFDRGREACTILDLNMDGRVDAFVYLDAAGAERRRELDYDRDGRTDEVQLFERGELRVKQRETNFDDKLDTWDFYENRRLVRRERDSGSDGIIDQWWDYDRPDRPQCAMVYADTNGDGAPDKSSGIDLCKDEDADPPSSGAASAADPGKAQPNP